MTTEARVKKLEQARGEPDSFPLKILTDEEYQALPPEEQARVIRMTWGENGEPEFDIPDRFNAPEWAAERARRLADVAAIVDQEV